MNCRECGKPVGSQDINCLHCGSQLKEKPASVWKPAVNVPQRFPNQEAISAARALLEKKKQRKERQLAQRTCSAFLVFGAMMLAGIAQGSSLASMASCLALAATIGMTYSVQSRICTRTRNEYRSLPHSHNERGMTCCIYCGTCETVLRNGIMHCEQCSAMLYSD